jgi:hypothetical protein
MSDNFDLEEVNNKLSLVVRKPQEGKTFICITSITSDASSDVHIVLTMNTLSAGMQFFGRMEEEVGPKNIIVFNSKKSSAGNCLYAKNSSEVFRLLKSNPTVKVVVCCANKRRFSESLMEIFKDAEDSNCFTSQNRKFKLHIDEAHKYIPENRDYVRQFNACDMVSKMVGYSASPDPIFTMDPNDSLFNSIYICDIESEYGMIRSPDYFGVKNCSPVIIENEIREDALLQLYGGAFEGPVPEHIVRLSLTEKEREKGDTLRLRSWYGKSFPFSIGDEKLLFSFLEYILPRFITTSGFSYHFVPAYCRKTTHYQIAEMILQRVEDANIIVINGNGIQLVRMLTVSGRQVPKIIKTGKEIIPVDEQHKKALLEPSFVIQTLISDYPDRPTFVTGLVCVGMSVTLVNETLGNFDTIVMAHHHYKKEDIYQLCRFLFSYIKWSEESRAKIKRTKFMCLQREVYDIAIDYELYIEKLSTEHAGQMCGLAESRGIQPVPPTEKQLRRKELDSLLPFVQFEWKRFEVDGEDPEDEQAQIERAEKYFLRKSGKAITNRSRAKPWSEDPRFLACAITGKRGVYLAEDIEKKVKGNRTWDAYFQLLANKTRYASRMLVGYESLDNPAKYTIYIKSAVLQETDEVRAILAKYGKGAISDEDVSMDETAHEDETDDDMEEAI